MLSCSSHSSWVWFWRELWFLLWAGPLWKPLSSVVAFKVKAEFLGEKGSLLHFLSLRLFLFNRRDSSEEQNYKKISVISISLNTWVIFLRLHPEKPGFHWFPWINENSERVVKGCSVCKNEVPIFRLDQFCHRNYCQRHFHLALPNLKIWLSCLEKKYCMMLLKDFVLHLRKPSYTHRGEWKSTDGLNECLFQMVREIRQCNMKATYLNKHFFFIIFLNVQIDWPTREQKWRMLWFYLGGGFKSFLLLNSMGNFYFILWWKNRLILSNLVSKNPVQFFKWILLN